MQQAALIQHYGNVVSCSKYFTFWRIECFSVVALEPLSANPRVYDSGQLMLYDPKTDNDENMDVLKIIAPKSMELDRKLQSFPGKQLNVRKNSWLP
jgi:hypothetical protein